MISDVDVMIDCYFWRSIICLHWQHSSGFDEDNGLPDYSPWSSGKWSLWQAPLKPATILAPWFLQTKVFRPFLNSLCFSSSMNILSIFIKCGMSTERGNDDPFFKDACFRKVSVLILAEEIILYGLNCRIFSNFGHDLQATILVSCWRSPNKARW